MNLTDTQISDYALPAATQLAVGNASPFGKGAIAMLRQVYGFFYVHNFMVGVLGSRKACRFFLFPILQPRTPAARRMQASGGSLKTIEKESIMGNLIPFAQRFIAGISTRTVSARQLHKFLESKQDFSTWIKARISQYDFEENTDYLLTLHKNVERKSKGLQAKTEYFLTIDMAKELAMVERNEKGKQARRYFIDCEKKLLETQHTKKLLANPIADIPLTKPYKALPPTTNTDFYTAISRLSHLKSWAKNNHSNVMVDDIETVERCIKACDKLLSRIAESADFLKNWNAK